MLDYPKKNTWRKRDFKTVGFVGNMVGCVYPFFFPSFPSFILSFLSSFSLTFFPPSPPFPSSLLLSLPFSLLSFFLSL